MFGLSLRRNLWLPTWFEYWQGNVRILPVIWWCCLGTQKCHHHLRLASHNRIGLGSDGSRIPNFTVTHLGDGYLIYWFPDPPQTNVTRSVWLKKRTQLMYIYFIENIRGHVVTNAHEVLSLTVNGPSFKKIGKMKRKYHFWGSSIIVGIQLLFFRIF